MITVTYLGVEYDVPARGSAGMVDVIVRTPDRATTIAALLEQKLIVGAKDEVVDPDTGKVTHVLNGLPYYNEDGSIQPGDGVSIDFIGPVMLTPAVLDVDGETVLTPAVFDTRDHLNLRLVGYALERPSNVTPDEKMWVETLVLWHLYGTTDPVVNASEEAVLWTTVGLIEPDTIVDQDRVWL